MAVQAQRRGGGDRQKGELGRAMRYLFRYKKLTIFAILAMLVATAAQLVVPTLVQNIIDAITNNALVSETDKSGVLRGIVIAGVIVVLAAIARGVFSFAQNLMTQTLSQDIAFELRNDIYSKIQRLSFSYHDKNQTGQLMIRATDDVERLRGFIGQGMLIAVQALILVVGTIILMFRSNVRLTLYILPILPIAAVLFGIFGTIAQPLFKEVQTRLSKTNTILQENIAGIKVIKSFSSEAREKAKFDASIDDLMRQRIRIGGVFSFLFPFIFLIANIGQGAILYFGGRQIFDGTLTVGEWQKFSLYLVYIFLPMGQLGFIVSLMAQASASAARIFEILDAKNDVEDKPNATKLDQIEGGVEFEDVTFKYFESGDPVLQDINISAAPGQTIALLGTTGSGKTTVINLIPRFYDVAEGAVKIDGRDIRDVTLDSLREQIGIVLQETTLFTGTIFENIAFGRPEATLEEVKTAAKAAVAHEFIIGFPDGYDTKVGERGSTLSGGQKQRIAIARALLVDPRILIMDDSTSSVDYETESRIQAALDTLMEGRTSFVIAQRISTVQSADQILVLDKGKIIANGKHAELLESNAVYADIYHSQLA